MSLVDAFASIFAGESERLGIRSDGAFPLTSYQKKPVEFIEEYLGVELWDKQKEIVLAIAFGARVSVKSGHKVGKTRLAVCVAIWFYSCFEDARVLMTSVVARQVSGILWRELRKVLAKAPKKIPGRLSELPDKGLKADDFREIVGFTAREPEAVQGTSGANIMYIVDEASGVDDEIFTAIDGNRAGGGDGSPIRVLMLGNPTIPSGEFFRSHYDKKEFYTSFTVSSDETPNVLQKKIVIRGLATWEWCDEKKREWGEDSAIYQIRVKGNYARTSERAIIGIQDQIESEERFENFKGKPKGRLHVGVDVARYGDDDTAIALRRGNCIFKIITFNGLSEDAVAHEVIQAIRTERKEGEPPAMLKVDSCGAIGMKVCFILSKYDSQSNVPGQREIELIPVNVAERAPLEMHYHLLRDQLWFALRDWVRDEGAIVPDTKLAPELITPTFEYDVRGRYRVSSKDSIRSILKRSPDRADACALAVWDPSVFQPKENVKETTETETSGDAYDVRDVVVY